MHARLIRTENWGGFYCQQSELKVNAINIGSPFNFLSTNITTKSFYQANVGTLTNSRLLASSSFSQKNGLKLWINKSLIQTPDADIIELTAEQESVLNIDNVRVQEKLALNKSRIKSQNLVDSANSQLVGNNGSAWVISEVLIDGKAYFENSHLEVKRLSSNGETTIKRSRCKAETIFRSNGRLIVDETLINANTLDLNRHYELSMCKIDSVLVTQRGDGNFSKCTVNSQFLDSLNNSNNKMTESCVKIDFGYFEGNLNLKQSEMNVQVIDQVKGTMQLLNKTILRVKQSISTSVQSELNVNNSAIKTTDDKQLLGGFEGKIDAESSAWSFKSLYLFGQVSLNKSAIDVESELGLSGQNQRINSSSLSSNNIYLSGNSHIEQSGLISRNNMIILNNGRIKASESRFKAEKNLKIFGELSMLHSDLLAADIEIYTKLKLTQSKAKASANLNSHIDSTFQIDQTNVSAKNININSLEATKSQLTVEDAITFNYKSKSSLKDVQVRANKKIEIQMNAEVTGENVGMKTDFVSNRGNININGLLIDSEFLENHTGKINGGNNLILDVNKAVYNFLGSIAAKNATINTGFCFNAIGKISGTDHLSVNSLINANLFGIYQAHNTSINNLLNLDCGLVLPSLPSSPSALFSKQNLLSYSRIALTNIFPKMSCGINLAFRFVPLTWELGRGIYDVATDSSKKWSDLLPSIDSSEWRNFRLNKILPTVLTVKNLIITGTNLYNSVQGLDKEYKDYSWGSISAQLNAVSPESLFGCIGTAFGSSLMCDSMISVNTGIQMSQNVINSDWFSFNLGVQAGWQSLTHNTHTLVNQGMIAGMQTTLTGTSFTNNGILADNNKMYLRFDTIDNDRQGRIIAQNAYIQGTVFNNTGHTELSDHTKINVDTFKNNMNSILQVRDQSLFAANHFENAGSAAMHNSSLNPKQDIDVYRSGNLIVKDSTTSAKNVIVEGSAEFTNHDTPGGIELESKMVVKEGGKLVMEHGSLQADGLDHAGQAVVKNFHLNLNKDIYVTKTGDLSLSQSITESRRLVVDGRAEFKGEAMNENNQATVRGTLRIHEDLIVHERGQLMTENMNVTARNASYQGTAEHRDTQLNLSQDFMGEKNSHVTFDNSVLLSQNVSSQGRIDALASLLKAEETMDAYKDSQLNTNSSSLESKNAQLEAKMNLDKTIIQAEQNALIKKGADISTQDTLLKANNINYEAKTNFSSYFGLDAKEQLTTSSTGVIHANGDNNLLEMKAKVADLNASVNVGNASLNVQNLPGAQEFIMRKGKYCNFVVSSSLTLKTDAVITLTASIDRICGLDIEAHSIHVNTDYQTNHNLHFKSLTGDVGLNSNLRGQNIFAESASNLYTTRSLNAKETIGLNANGEYINLGGFIRGDIVNAKAAAVRNYHYQSQNLPAHFRGAAGNNGSIIGRETYLEATQSNIENHGGLFQGTAYLQAIAKQDIINICNVQMFKGKYDDEKKFDPAIMNGGTGLDGNQIGLYLQAGNKMTNTASTIISQGTNYVNAIRGFESNAQYHTYVAKRKEKGNWLKEKTKVKIKTNVQNANMTSTNGQNIILSEEGWMKAVATDFVSKRGTQVCTKGNIELYSLKYEDKKMTEKEYLGGIIHSHKTKKDEHVVPVLIYDPGVTRLESMEGNIIGRGVVVLGNGDFQTVAKKGSISFSSDKLVHHLHERKRGFSISCPAIEQFSSMIKSGPKGILGHLEPSLEKINTLVNSNTGKEWMANAWNTALSGYNSYQAIMNNSLTELMTQRLGVDALFNPSVNLTYSMSDRRLSYETSGPAMFQRRNWEIEAGNNVSIQGVDIDIAENMKVKARNFELQGQDLNTRMSYERQSVSVGINVAGDVNVSGSYARNTSSSTHYQNLHMHVGNNLHVEVDNWHLNAANVDAGTLTGHVNNQLHLQSQQDNYRSKALSASASSDGQVSFFQNKSGGARINERTSIRVHQGINHDTEHELTVNTTINEGAEITSDGVNNYRSEVFINREVEDFERQRSFGINGNVKQLASMIQASNDHSEVTNDNNHVSQKIDTMTVSHSSKDFVAVQQATYHGKSGEMNTTDGNGYQVLRDKKQNITLDIPLINHTTFFSPKPVSSAPKKETSIEQNTPESVVNTDETNQENKEIEAESTIETQSSNVKASPASDNDLLIKMGINALGIKQEEIVTFLEKMGSVKVGRIFKYLGYGLIFTENLIDEKKNSSEDYLARAIVRTFVEAPITLSWRIALPLQVLAASTEGFTDRVESLPNAFMRKEMWEKYGADESLQIICSELFENEVLLESYGLTKGIQWMANFPSIAGSYAADKFTELRRKFAANKERQSLEQASHSNDSLSQTENVTPVLN